MRHFSKISVLASYVCEVQKLMFWTGENRFWKNLGNRSSRSLLRINHVYVLLKLIWTLPIAFFKNYGFPKYSCRLQNDLKPLAIESTGRNSCIKEILNFQLHWVIKWYGNFNSQKFSEDFRAAQHGSKSFSPNFSGWTSKSF